MNEDLGIKYFYDERIEEEIEVEIKQHPSDFVVQEVGDDKLCGFNFIIDMAKLTRSIHFLYSVRNKESIDESDLSLQDYELKDMFNLNLVSHLKEQKDGESNFMNYIKDYGVSREDLEVGNINLLSFINCEFIDKLKYLWNEIKKSQIKIFCGEGNKALRTKIYQILNRIPFIKSKTIDGQIVVEISSEGIFRTVVCKVMYNSMDICSKICKTLDLRNGRVGFAGNKDKKAVTFQEVSIDANFDCIFDLAYEYYDDVIFDVLKSVYKDPLNTFLSRDLDILSSDLSEISQSIDKNSNLLPMNIFNYVNLSIYLIMRYLLDKELNRDMFLEIKQKIEAILEGDAICEDYCKSKMQIYDIKRGDIKRLGDLKGNKFSIKLNDVTEINENKKFLNYFGTQRFGKCKNNHKIGEKILNKEYEEAVEMIMKNSRGYEAYLTAEDENKIKEITNVCDGTEKYIILMKLRGKTDKNIIFGLKREIRMLYLHAYQSFIYNKAINEELEKRRRTQDTSCDVSLDDLIIPLKKMEDKMLKGGSRSAVSYLYNLTGKSFDSHYEVSFFLGTSSYATIALRELLGRRK